MTRSSNSTRVEGLGMQVPEGEVTAWRQTYESLPQWLKDLYRWARYPEFRVRNRVARAMKRCSSDTDRLRLAEFLVGRQFPELFYGDGPKLWCRDAAFRDWYLRCVEPINMRSMERKWFIRELLKLVAHVPGDTAECGVYEGATSQLICEGTQRNCGKTHFGFDSFEGLSQPESSDGSHWSTGDLTAPQELATALLQPYRATLLKGWIPDRFEEVADRRFSFVHLDVDLAAPTRQSLEFFYPRLNPGGILVCDDYGYETCPGAYEACNTFFSDKGEPWIHAPTGQGFVIRQPD
ncbi:MAG: methyltransferase [Planctomyces sp.]|nr:methyltransferase [Planctomyces sp.]